LVSVIFLCPENRFVSPDVVSAIQKLSPERKQALGMILHDFQFAQRRGRAGRE
jgi:hypothetical protein